MHLPHAKLALSIALLFAPANAILQSKVLAQESGQQTLPVSKDNDAADKTSTGKTPSKKNVGKVDEQPAEGVTFSNPVTTKWKMIAKIRGGSGSAKNMIVTMPLPTEWPEQGVAVAEEDIPTTIANVKYRDLDSGVKQLVALIPQIRAREEITISMTFVVSTSQITSPVDTSVFVRPKKTHRAGRSYLGVSPQIKFRDSKLKKQVKAIVADKQDVWSEVEAIYDWVRDNVEDNSDPPKDSVDVFRDKSGCNEDKVSLFVAMCRAHKIPARFVWVQGTQYAEFMLVDAQANAHWFPCSVGGVREFGSMSEPRIVLQKGDSIRVPEKEGKQKFVGEFATCQGKSKPSVRFQRQVLSVD